jgi:hypothetical protein
MLETLKQHAFQPGVSGNPGGRPKVKPISDGLRALLDEQYSGSEKRFKGLPNARVLALRMFELAFAGDLSAAKEIADRVEGKTVQIQQLQGPGGGAIPFTDVPPAENEKRIAELLSQAGLETQT